MAGKSAFLYTDHDECASDSDNNCEQNCHNTETSHYCTCKDGYKLGTDGYSCNGSLPSVE